MAEVTDVNWPSMLKKLEAALSKAIFVAFDNEFSGLRDESKEDTSLFDDNASRYLKIRNHINDFVIIQFGVSVFSLDPETGNYVSEVFTIYLFPGTTGRKDSSLKFQASSVEFLCRYQFDFNKMMHHGIPYIPIAEQEVLKKSLADGSYMKHQMSRFSVDLMDLHKSLCSQVMTWAVGASEGDTMRLACPPVLFPYLLHKDLRNSCLDILTWNDTGSNDIMVRKVNLEVRKKSDAENNKKEEQEAFDTLIGFSKFFSLLVEKDIPIVGHNLLLDLMMMFQQFIGPLPDSYTDFKRKLVQCFPQVFDTKFMSVEIKRKNYMADAWDSDLQKLYNYLSSDKCENFTPRAPKISTSSYIPAGGDKILAGGDACQTDSKGHFHDAGWDSYCSGFVFIRLAYINALIDEDLKAEEKAEDFHPSWEDMLKSIRPLQNKVHVSMGQSDHIHLSGSDSTVKGSHIIHLQSKGKRLLMEDIEDAFLQFGSLDVKILHPQRALVAASSQECVKDILKFCKKHPDYKAHTYSALRHSLAVRNTLWASSIASVGTGLMLVLLGLQVV